MTENNLRVEIFTSLYNTDLANSYGACNPHSSNVEITSFTYVNINRYRITSGTAKASRLMIHELGHVLGLDHPDTSCTDYAFMV